MSGPVVLFDLDGTVLTFEGPSPGPGRTALEQTMRELHGLEQATAGIRVAGGTDRAIARAMLERAGIVADDEATGAILDGYVSRLERILDTRRYRPIGDVAGAVRALEARGVVVGVATGNTRAGARLKLASAGLGDVFDLERGAYGCEHEARDALVRLAAERCGAVRDTWVVVVGDTDRDVAAARSLGPYARVVGIAIDAAARAELEAAGADVIVESCAEALVEAVLAQGRHDSRHDPMNKKANAPDGDSRRRAARSD